jgi:cyclase
MITDTVSVPVIAHGGCANPDDVVEVIKNGGADAVAIASILHYDLISKISSVDEDFKLEGNTAYLDSGRRFNKIKTSTLLEIKGHLKNYGIPVRI